MSYNDGQVHIDFYDESVDIEKIANDFSEGDYKLRCILLNLWKNGIMTESCCNGHDDGRHAYIAFIINEKSKKLIQATSEYLFLQDSRIELDFVHSKDYYIFIVYMGAEKAKEKYYNFINSLLSQKIEHESINNNIPEYGYYLLKFARERGVHCRFCVTKDEMMFGFSYPGELQIFDENSLLLDDIIQAVKETGNIPLCPLKCNEQSLQEFINIIYHNTFMDEDITQK